MTSVVIADDQELVRSGLRLVLEARGIRVLGEAPDGRRAVDTVRQLAPDGVLMDVRMPVLDGIAATREVTRLGGPTRVLILTTYDLDEYVYQALRASAELEGLLRERNQRQKRASRGQCGTWLSTRGRRRSPRG